jgi:hypothetical protein
MVSALGVAGCVAKERKAVDRGDESGRRRDWTRDGAAVSRIGDIDISCLDVKAVPRSIILANNDMASIHQSFD